MILKSFSKTFFVWSEWTILGREMAHPNDSGSANRVDESNNNGLYQKSFGQNKWAILGPEMAHPHHSGSTLRIFLKLCRMKGANRYKKILLVVFREKLLFGTI